MADELAEHPEFVAQKVGADGKGHRSKLSTSPDTARDRVVDYIERGLSVRAACAKVGRTEETYRWWRKTVPGFGERVDRARARLKGVYEAPEVGDFGVWRKKYLMLETFPHQWQWVDVLEGREPREFHPAVQYAGGRAQRILINTPPFHAKSSTVTIDYVVYRICKDPNVRVIIISESRDMARKMLVAIKDRLTHPKYEKLQADFGPAGGFKAGSGSWTQNLIYVGGRDSGEKDPTVEVLGVGSQIYGARADLIIMDDCVTLKTARTMGQREKLMEYIDQDVSSRLDSKFGKLVLVGTRVSPADLYSELLKRDADKPDDRRVWTYLAQPAVLEYADTFDEWVTLWPYLWDGEALSLRRDEIDSTTWNLVYQQQQVAEDAVFPSEAVDKCRYMGSVGPLAESKRPGGMQGLYVVAGLDPATSGFTGIVVLGVDKKTRERFVLDVVNRRGMTPGLLRETVAGLCAKFKINEWRIEKNAVQAMISQDPDLREIVHRSGGRIIEHFTGNNKWDAQFGVMSMASMFLGALETPVRNLIWIPDNSRHKGVNALLDQLVSWSPEAGKSAKTDLVMALWFADLGCRAVIDLGDGQTHVKNKWLSNAQASKRRTVNFDDFLSQIPVA